MTAPKTAPFTVPANAGDVNIDLGAGWGTPGAALFLFGGNTGLDTSQTGMYAGIGFSDGTNDVCVAVSDQHGNTTSDSYWGLWSQSLAMPDFGGGFRYRSSNTAFSADNIDITIAVHRSVDSYGGAQVWDADDIESVAVGFVNMGDTAAQRTVDLANDPDLIYLASAGGNRDPSASDAPSDNALLSLGIAYRGDSAWIQDAMSWSSRDNRTSSHDPSPEVTNWVHDDAAIGRSWRNAFALKCTVEDHPSGTGFGISPRNEVNALTAAGNQRVLYMAITFKAGRKPQCQIDNAVINFPDPSPDTHVSSASFTPNGFFAFFENSTDNDDIQGAVAIGDGTALENIAFTSDHNAIRSSGAGFKTRTVSRQSRTYWESVWKESPYAPKMQLGSPVFSGSGISWTNTSDTLSNRLKGFVVMFGPPEEAGGTPGTPAEGGQRFSSGWWDNNV